MTFVSHTVNMALLRRWLKVCPYRSTPSSSGSVPRPSTPRSSSPSCRSTASTPAGTPVTCVSLASKILSGEKSVPLVFGSVFFFFNCFALNLNFTLSPVWSRSWLLKRSAGRWFASRQTRSRVLNMRCWAPPSASSPISPRSELLWKDGSVKYFIRVNP